jgi:hypothetical protein
VPPEGWTGIQIVVQVSCGNLVGVVTDFDTGQPIAGATVTLVSTGQTTTTDAQGNFTFTCVKPAGQYAVTASAPGYTEELEVGTVPASGNSNPVNIKLHRVSVMAYTIKLTWGMQPADLDAHLSGPDPAGGRFHLFYGNRLTPPVSFADLDTDDTSSQGPEVITIRRSPATAAGTFVPGQYRYWVHNYSGLFNSAAVFAGSNAVVVVSAIDAGGNATPIGLPLEVLNATPPEDDLWHVIDLTIDAAGNITTQVVQTFQSGTQTTVL